MRRLLTLSALLWALLALTTALGDELAARRAAADRVVLQPSATPATGPLPPPAPPQAAQHPPGTWVGAAKRLVKRAQASTKPAVDVSRWRLMAGRALKRASLKGASLHGGGSTLSIGGAPARLLEVRATFPGAPRSARFVRIEGGASGPAEAYFAKRFEVFEAGGYYVRPADVPGTRAAFTNTIDPKTKSLLWQVGRVLIEVSGLDPATAKRLDAAAKEEGLYAARLPSTPLPKGKGEAGGPDESDDDLPFEEFLEDVPGLEDAPFNGSGTKDKPKPKTEAGGAYDIPSLRATVRNVRFFESGDQVLPPASRTYKQRFVDTETRLICWELDVTHPAPGRRREFSIQATWRRQVGSTQATQTYATFLNPGWVDSQHNAGKRMVPGTWPTGSYRVDLSVGGKLVGSGSFHLVTTAYLSDIQLKHNQVGVRGRKGFLILYTLALEGRRDKETHVGVRVQFRNGTALRDLDGAFKDANGHVATHQGLRAKYDSALWTQSQIFFPVEQLHLVKGRHAVRLQLWVYDPKTRAVLAESGWMNIDVNQN